MIRAYYNAKSDDPEVKRFVDRLFETSSDPNIRAAVIRAKADFRPKMKPDDLETLRTVAVSDKDFEVRLAALAGLGRDAKELDFIVERAVTERTGQVLSRQNSRSAAVQKSRMVYQNFSRRSGRFC
jgi:hypothetical protein